MSGMGDVIETSDILLFIFHNETRKREKSSKEKTRETRNRILICEISVNFTLDIVE
jgi:hypothetical protein